MAARQAWMFLTDADLEQLLEALERRDPGHLVSWGRYLRGDPNALLVPGRPPPGLGPAWAGAGLERREALPGERRLYLFHRKQSADLVTHEQPAGPFAGWRQIDEERSDCLVLRLPITPPGELQPARLYGHVTWWRAGDKVKKRTPFAIWANQTLRQVLALLPAGAVKFMRVGPEARAAARAGTLRLTYLHRPIGPDPVEGAPQAPTPDGAVTEETIDAPDEGAAGP